MAQANETRDVLARLRSVAGGPITSSSFVAGVLLILSGAVLQTGVWAGMFGIIGVLLVLLSVFSRFLIWMYQTL